MRRTPIFVLLVLAGSSWLAADQRPAPSSTPVSMLSVDSIMRGPKLVGSPPSAVRWSRDSSKIYFTWQKASDARTATYAVNKDGSGLTQLTPEEARTLDVPQTGRFDRTRRRVLAAESGDIVMYDVATGARRFLTRTGAAESAPRWARNDTAVTFMRDGNLFLISLDTATAIPFAQLTDIVAPEAATAANAAAGGRGAGTLGGGRGGGGQRGGGTGAGAAGTAAATTDSQRFLQDQERDLFEFIRKQIEERNAGRGGRGGRGGAAAAGPDAPPIARLPLTPRQTLADLQLSTDERYVWVGITERPDGTSSRGQDTPNYVTESAYPEMISGRTNVGDAQTRRALAILDLKENKTVWADASAFTGTERKAKSDDPDVPRLLNWGMPEYSDDGSLSVIAVRSLDNKDRWFVKVDPATGKAAVIDTLHDEAWIRESSVTVSGGGGGGFGGGAGAGAGVAWLADNKRVLFLSEKDGWMHLYSLDVSAATPQARALTTGKWEVTSAQLSSDRKTVFVTTNEVHPGERQFYTLSVDGGARTRITTATGSHDVTVSPDEKTLAVVYSYSTKPPELMVMPLAPGAEAKQITTSSTDEWRNFKWIDPKVITYKTRDGVDVYARLFTPEMIGAKRDPRKPGVVFVHGAGYLQNAHKYWSTYFREYMFHNLLA